MLNAFISMNESSPPICCGCCSLLLSVPWKAALRIGLMFSWSDGLFRPFLAPASALPDNTLPHSGTRVV